MEKFPKIKGYKLLKLLGRGGMSRVYLAVEDKLEREVAIKVLLSHYIEDEGIRKRFLKEAKTAASLRHSNIVSIFDIGETEDGKYYFVMEYLSGGSLKDKIAAGKLSPEYALYVLKEIAEALFYAHKKGFIHRDIKPANIMFREDGVPVLADFGIAKTVNATTKLTQTGISIGTPYYMSPEQIQGEKITGKTDVYSLGIVLFEMLTGEVPYDAETTIAIIMKHLNAPIPKLYGVKGVNEGSKEYYLLQTLINKMMAKKPNERFSSEDVLKYINKVKKVFEEKRNLEETIIEDVIGIKEFKKEEKVKEKGEVVEKESEGKALKKEVEAKKQDTLLEEDTALRRVEIRETSEKETAKKSRIKFYPVIVAALFLIVFLSLYLFLKSPGRSKDGFETSAYSSYTGQNPKEEEGVKTGIIKKEKISKEENNSIKDKNKKSDLKNNEITGSSESKKEVEKEGIDKEIPSKSKEEIKDKDIKKSENSKINSKIKTTNNSQKIRGLTFEEEIKNINILFKDRVYPVLTKRLMALYKRFPKKKSEIRNMLNKFLKDKGYREFLKANTILYNRLKAEFPDILFFKKSNDITNKELLKTVVVQVENVPLSIEYEKIFSLEEKIFLYKKKAVYNFETGKKYKIDSKPNLPVIACGGNYFFTTEYGSVYMIKKTGEIKRIFKAKWDINYAPTPLRGKFYVVSMDKNIYCFDCSGKRLWKFKTGWEVESSVAVDKEENFYYITKGSLFTKVSPNFKKVFERKVNFKKPREIYFSSGLLYIRSDDNKLYILDESLKNVEEIKRVSGIKKIKDKIVVFTPKAVLVYKGRRIENSFKCLNCKDAFGVEKVIFVVSPRAVFVFDMKNNSLLKRIPLMGSFRVESSSFKNGILVMLGKSVIKIVVQGG